MSWDAGLTLAVLIGCFGLLALNRYAPDLILMAGVVILFSTGVLTPAEALAGLANPGMVTVGVLYVVVSGLQETGGINWLVENVLGKPKTLGQAQMKVMLPVAGLSAFLNNTPVVAMFIPALQDWARRYQLSPSKLMIPLSYAAIAGGVCTLIGTSTNLVVNGLIITETQLEPLSMFDITWIGVPIAVTVIVFTSLFSRCCLPERKPAMSQLTDVREYTIEMKVTEDSPLIGKRIEDAGLRQLPGLYLIEIERGGELLTAVSSHERLHANDRLVFTGVIDSVVDLQKMRGLELATEQVFKIDAPQQDRHLIEAVVSNTCPLVGKNIREGRFRTVYNAAVIAVARNGERINRKIGDIILHPGDTLLLETHQNFLHQQCYSRDFFLVSYVGDAPKLSHKRAPIALVILVGMVAAVAFGVLSMLKAAMVAAVLMLLTKCTNERAVRRMIDWQVLLVIAASFAIGTALAKTGAAATVATHFIALADGVPSLTLAMVFVMTALLTSLATNNAAAVIMFPLALSTAEQLQVNFMAFAITIMVGASASFATPIGYQTNLMVYGPGGYHFMDYVKIGVPLTILVGIVTILLAPVIWPF